jgi:hypothetical protein
MMTVATSEWNPIHWDDDSSQAIPLSAYCCTPLPHHQSTSPKHLLIMAVFNPVNRLTRRLMGNTGKYVAVESNNFMEMWKEFIHRTCFCDIGISNALVFKPKI